MPDGIRYKEGIKQAALKLAVCVSVAIVVALAAGVNAHEPITTKVRFNREVVRVLQRNCLGCHRTGGIAMSLETYEEARPWAKAIKEEILEKRMPPWHAVKGYGEFLNAPSLTQHEVDVIVNWVEGGAPKGDDKDLPSGRLVKDDWTLGKPNLTLKPSRKVEVAADADEERTFVLPTKLKEDRWLAAVEFRPGKRSVVHCATVMVEDPGSAAQAVPSPSQKAGVNRLISPAQVPVQMATTLAKWLPGQKAVALPEGVAQLLPAGSSIMLKIHYRGAGETVKDQSEVGLFFAKAPARTQLREVAISSPDAVIPAGAESHRVDASLTLKGDSEAIAIRPRAHALVISLQATAYKPDGTQEVLLWARGHRNDWQPTYYFRQPVLLPKGTRVEVVAHFDNSDANSDNPNDPAKQVRWSELTSEPLCSLLVLEARN
jgi:ribosomal protein S28E/S33